MSCRILLGLSSETSGEEKVELILWMVHWGGGELGARMGNKFRR